MMFFSIFFAFLVLTISTALIVANWKAGQRKAELGDRIQTLQKEIQTLEKEREELLAKISAGSDQDYLEKEARERFNLKKPGEEAVTILKDQMEETAAAGYGKSILNFFDFFKEKGESLLELFNRQ